MGAMLSSVLAVLVIGSLTVLCGYVIVAVVAVVATLARARASLRLEEDLDRVLAEIVGPRSETSVEVTTLRSDGDWL